jgi:hypothetical protein
MEPRWRRWSVEAALMFLLFASLTYVCLSVRGGLIEPDTLYHFKIASLILREGPWVDIRWLPYTVLGDHGPDHHWFWHLVLAPFALIPDPWQALRVAAAVTCGAVPAMILLVCRALMVPFAPLFAIVAVCGASLPERLTRLRADNAMFILLSLALLLMARNRTVALALLSFVFMQTYHGAILLLPMVVAFAVASLVAERTVSLRIAIAVLAGLGLGLVVSPWFPENISYLLFHTLFKLQSQNWHLVGTEWRHPSWLQIVQFSWMNHVLLLWAMATYAARKRWSGSDLRLRPETLATLLLAALALLLYRDAMRNASYYSLFSALAAGLIWRDCAVTFVDRRRQAVATVQAGVFAAAVLVLGARLLVQAPTYGPPLTRYAAIVEYLEAHVERDGIVFNADWDIFPYLFWRSDKLRYVSGLDGNYLAYGDPARFKIWYDVYLGLPARADTLQKAFATQWVVLPRNGNMDLIAQNMISEPGTALVMVDDDGWLIRLGDDRELR